MIYFPKGIYGFENITNWSLNKISDSCYNLRSSNFSFILLKHEDFISSKDMDNTLTEYNIDAHQYEIMFITTLTDDCIELNLRAPIIIDFKEKKGWQIILLNNKYPICYPFADKQEMFVPKQKVTK